MQAETETRLRPDPTWGKGGTSVARVADDWYVVCRSRRLRPGQRLAIRLLGTPIVVFRGDGGAPGALLDRCAHRNVPLSLGRVEGERLTCAYHGWSFERGGDCKRVPALCGAQESRGRRVPSFPVREQQGLVWVYATPDVEPARDPYTFPHVGEAGYTTAMDELEAEGSLHAVAENALDVPHTAFLHGGLFRSDGAGNDIQVEVRRWHDRVEAEFIGEPRPKGLAGRLLAPGGGVVIHFDRFLLPGILQVEYRLGDRSHLVLSAALTPIEDFRTRLFAVISFRLPVPGWLVALLLRPLARHIFSQDARMLARQTATIRDFGGEQYMSTEVDVLGPHILRLLRNAERGDRSPVEAPFTRSLTMHV